MENPTKLKTSAKIRIADQNEKDCFAFAEKINTAKATELIRTEYISVPENFANRSDKETQLEQNFIRQKYLFYNRCRFKRCLIGAITFVCLIGFSACKDDVFPLHEPLKLEGTAWKLLYFMDIENNTKREPEYHPVDLGGGFIINRPPHELDFTLAFNCDSIYDIWYMRETPFVFSGRAFRNILMSDEMDNFLIDYNSNTFTADRISTTLVYGETDDGNLYLNIFGGGKKSFPFELSVDTLKLYYNDNKNCLIFRRFYND